MCAVAYRTQGLQSAPEIDQATAEYRQSEDHVGRFPSECAILAPYATASKADFFAAYKKWCEDQGEYAISQKKLGTYLMEKGFDSCRKTDGKRFWIGLGLRGQE